VDDNRSDNPGWLVDDQVLLRGSLRRYEPRLAQSYLILCEQLAAHHLSLAASRDLAYRHLLPYFAALDAMNFAAPGAERVGAGAVLAYSLPLVLIDSALDGDVGAAGSGPDDPYDRWEVTAAAHVGYQMVAVGTRSTEAVSLMARTSTRILHAMRRDRESRWSVAQLTPDSTTVSSYWNSADSRLNGSGIGYLMMGLANVVARGNLSPTGAGVGRALGQLRQISDELIDVVEDVSTGLVTLPVIYALLRASTAERTASVVREAWHRSRTGDAKLADEIAQRLRNLVIAGGGPVEMRARADAILTTGIERVRQDVPFPEPIEELLITRRLQIDRAIRNGLQESSHRPTVDELLTM
jgi:hypothetical protein